MSVLHQDDFYKDEATLFRENVFYDAELQYHNWELPECFDGQRFRQELQRSTKESLASCEGDSTSTSSSTHDFVVLEGILIFEDPELTSSMRKRYFVDLPYAECRDRRAKRTYLPPEPAGYFDKYYWPSYVELKTKVEEKVARGELEITYLDSEKESIDELVVKMVEEVTDILGRAEA